MFKKKKIVIFGGNGFLGLPLVKKLLQKKSYLILVVDLKKPNAFFKKNPKVKYIKYDVTKISELKLATLIKNSYAIFYKIALLGNPEFSTDNTKVWNYLSINSLFFWKLINVAKKSNVKKIIVDSSVTAISDFTLKSPMDETTVPLVPTNFYGLSKAILEDISRFCITNNIIDIKILRYPRVYSSEQNNFIMNFSKKIIHNKSLKIFDHFYKIVDLIHLDDAVEMSYKILNYNGTKKIFHASYNNPLTLIQIIKKITKKLNIDNLKIEKSNIFKSPREPLLSSLKNTFSSKELKIKFNYNIEKIIDDAVQFNLKDNMNKK